MRRRCRAGKIVDLINLHLDGIDHIMPHKFKTWVIREVAYVILSPGEIVIQADNLVTLVEEALAEMGAEKAGSSCDENTFGHDVVWKLGSGFR
jgi:hypothetical protein